MDVLNLGGISLKRKAPSTNTYNIFTSIPVKFDRNEMVNLRYGTTVTLSCFMIMKEMVFGESPNPLTFLLIEKVHLFTFKGTLNPDIFE